MMEMVRVFCVGIILYMNDKIRAPWVATGCLWPTLGARERADMLSVREEWTRQGYAWRLELVELVSAHVVLHTRHLRALQRAWRRRWRGRVRWLLRRPLTGERWNRRKWGHAQHFVRGVVKR